MDHYEHLREGCEVFTADGDKIGQVKEVQGGSFKVDAKMQPDYWLACENISSEAMGRVTVSFTKERLDDFKMDSPATGGGGDYTSPTGTTTGDYGTTGTATATRREGDTLL